MYLSVCAILPQYFIERMKIQIREARSIREAMVTQYPGDGFISHILEQRGFKCQHQ